jgi:predicted enzyme related to lactoylglutathione lyase
VAFYQRKDSEINQRSTADDVMNVLRPGNIVITTTDPEGLCEFWRDLTGYELRPLFDGYLGLRDPSGRGPHLTFQRVEVDDGPSRRCHIDFYANDPDDVAERALQLGADFVRRVVEGDVRWVVLADPEGNEFCVVASVGPDRTP